MSKATIFNSMPINGVTYHVIDKGVCTIDDVYTKGVDFDDEYGDNTAFKKGDLILHLRREDLTEGLVVNKRIDISNMNKQRLADLVEEICKNYNNKFMLLADKE